MKINQLFLADHIRLRFSNIREIEINTGESDTHLIIGSNGSGKSSILHEFIPYPPTKAYFGPEGFKSLDLEHNNHQYRMTYGVRDGHQFICDGINLNISGTNEIQKELIREHFGITNDIHTLLKCSLPICTMLPSNRKKLLMSLNPTDVSLFIEKYKSVHKDVVAYGNNLDMLYNRQKQLMMQRIPEEQYREMLERKSILENQERILLVWMTTTSSERDRYSYISNEFSIDELNKTIVDYHRSLRRFSDITRVDYHDDIIRMSTRCDVIQTEIQSIEEKLVVLIDELDGYEGQKKLVSENRGDLVKELSTLNQRMECFSFSERFTPIPEDMIREVRLKLNSINNLCVQLSYINYPNILSRAEVESIDRELFIVQAKIDTLQNIMSQLTLQKQELVESIRTYRIGDNCDQNGCELLQMYNGHIKSKQAKLDEIDKQLDDHKIENDHYLNTYAELKEQHTIQSNVWGYVDKILHIIYGDRFLSSTYSEQFVVSQIRIDVILIVSIIQQFIADSESYVEYLKLKESIRLLEEKNSSLEAKKTLSISLLDREIQSHSKLIEEYRNRIKTMMTEYDNYQIRKNHLIDFSLLKDELIQFEKQYNTILHTAESNAAYEYFDKLYRVMNLILQSIRLELIQLTNICKEQELLIVRLDTEIDSVIDVIKPKYDESKHIESALYELPIIYTTKFVNDIIDTANVLIRDIMTYRVELIPIADDSDFSFSFPVIVGDIPLKDINECSEGQKAIIQLAFNLAVIIELGLNALPIFCDEVDRALDVVHSERLTETLLSLIDKNIINQLFVIGHDKSFLAAFQDTDNVIVLNGDNIDLPTTYNANVKISYS